MFLKLELVSFPAKCTAGNLELGKAFAMGCFKTLWALRYRGVFGARSDFCDGTAMQK